MRPFISVIIPTLNEEKYIEDTLKSIKCQSYPGKYEIIVADGMSTDKTVEIVKKYADKVIKVRKKCPGAERNAGARAAKGSILVFIDADTIPSANLLSSICKEFEAEDVVGVTCPIFPINGKRMDFIIYIATNMIIKNLIKLKKPVIGGPCCAYRRNVFDLIGGFDEELENCEDIDLNRKIYQFGKILFLESTPALTSIRRWNALGRIKYINRCFSTLIDYMLGGENIRKNVPELVR